MKVLTENETSEWLSAAGWVRLGFRTLKSTVPVNTYRGGRCDLAGVVAADMANLFLSQFTSEPLSGGLLEVTSIRPPDPPAIRIFQHLVHMYASVRASQQDFRCLFSGEPESTLTAMAWCIACGWEFYFVAAGRHFAVMMDDDNQFTVCWAKDERMKSTLKQLLQNLEFRNLDPPGDT